MTLTIEQLENALHQPGPVGSPDLHAIRRAGTRRRRTRRTGVAAGTVLGLTALTGLGLPFLHHHDVPPANLPLATVTPHPLDPSTLSPLARKVLKEVPGAEQVSDDVVLIPSHGAMPSGSDPGTKVERPTALPGRAMTGVTSFDRQDMPSWLYDEIHNREKAAAGPDGSYSMGSLVEGVGVDQGSPAIGCASNPEWSTLGCGVSYLFRTGAGWERAWGMGTDSFLDPGHGMQLFSDPQYEQGRPATLWIGGRDGTDIASVDFVLADHTRVPATISSGTISPGDTLFWALVPGELTDVVARDADGNVVEDHQVKSCSDPVDCEVR